MLPNFVRREAAHAIIDLTGNNDEEDAPVTRLTGSGRVSTKRPGLSSSQHSKSSTPVNGFSSRQTDGQSGAHNASPRRGPAKSSSGTIEPANGADSKFATSESVKSSQSQQSGKLFERNQKTSKTTGSKAGVPQQPITEPILVLSDDGEEDLPRQPAHPARKKPRTLDTEIKEQLIPSDLSRGSTVNMMTAQLKRPRDLEHRDDGAMPPKRQKLTQSFGTQSSTLHSDNRTYSSPNTNLGDKVGQSKAQLSQSGSRNGARDRKQAVTSSPSHRSKDATLASTRRTANPGSSPRANVTRDAFDSASKGSRAQSQFNSTNSEPARQHPATRKPGTQDGEDYDDDDRSSNGSGGQSSRRDTTPRIRRETAKAQAISAERLLKTQSSTNAQSPPGQDSGGTTQLADRSRTNHPASMTQDTSSRSKSATSGAHPEGRNLAKELASDLQHSGTGKKTDKLKVLKPQSLPFGSAAAPDFVSQPSNVQSFEPDFSPLRNRRHEKTETSRLKHPKDGLMAETDQKAIDGRPARPNGHSSSKASPATGRRRAVSGSDEADLQLRSEAQSNDDQGSGTSGSKISSVRPTVAASAKKPSSSYSSQLPLGTRVEKILGRYIDEMGDDNEYWASVLLTRARQWKEYNQDPGCLTGATYESDRDEKPMCFAKLRPLAMLPQKGNPSTNPDRLWGIERITPTGRGAGPTRLSASYSMFESNVPDVPSYAHYVSIKKNILAPNVAKLICWPYFGDDYEPSSVTSLRDQYHLDVEDRERKLKLLLKAQKYEKYVQSALFDLECTWADVLRYLLEDEPDVGDSKDARDVLKNRDDHLEHDFSRISEQWRSILTELPASTPEKLARTALLCDNFQKLAGFSLWHIARKSEFASLPDDEYGFDQNLHLADNNDLTCRICLRFNCPYHGELKEQDGHESDDDSESIPDSVVATDIIHPPRVNYRTRVAIPPPYTANENDANTLRVKNDKKDIRFWRKDEFSRQASERGPFYPCHHPGELCADAQCSCYANKVPCEKMCSCAPDCSRKFHGCSCSTARFKKGMKGPCFEDERCVCYQLGRECDPDLCGDCGACEVVDPVNKHNDDITNGRCRNCSIQRDVPKQTLLGDSGVHGLGLYACEEIREHDFVGEYKGEIITKEEAERRGAVYEIQKLSYLFTLNATQEIDSTNFGNKIRFINHNGKGKANLYPRIIMVNTVHRIALYASNTIRPGQELFFDYGPMFPEDQLGGGKKSKKSAPHVRNAELVRNFLDVEESEDEVGNIRAKGVTHGSRARTKTGVKKARGGARPNAGRKKKAHGEEASAKGMREQDAGERLAAYNVSDEIRSDIMDIDNEPGAEEDEEYEDDDDSESAEYYENESSERSDSEEYDEDDD